MYLEARKVLGKGLSPSARILLGSVSGLFGIVMILIAPGMAKPVAIYIFGALCLVITIMCITKGVIRRTIGRIIGLICFGLSVWYLMGQLIGGEFYSGRRSQPSVVNAVLFFFAFGLPGIWYAIKAEFPASKEDHSGEE